MQPEQQLSEMHAFLTSLGARGCSASGTLADRLAALISDYHEGKPLPSERVIHAARFRNGTPPPLRRPMGSGSISFDPDEEQRRPMIARMGDVIEWLEADGTLRPEGIIACRRLAGFPTDSNYEYPEETPEE